MFFSTDMCGKSAYDWNMRLIGLRCGGSASRSCPSRDTDPESGSSNPASTRRRVVLPQPDGPSSAKNSFSRMSMLTLSRATTSPNERETASILMSWSFACVVIPHP